MRLITRNNSFKPVRAAPGFVDWRADKLPLFQFRHHPLSAPARSLDNSFVQDACASRIDNTPIGDPVGTTRAAILQDQNDGPAVSGETGPDAGGGVEQAPFAPAGCGLGKIKGTVAMSPGWATAILNPLTPNGRL